ncbi:MAG TPA: DUF2232 domain-containing protein [Candidatus Binatia bacterium]|jgi:uncharacterized protein YybS (DUF2232 family)
MELKNAKSFAAALAATVLLTLLAAAVPFAGMLFLPLAPQPALAFGLTYGMPSTVVLLAVATGLIVFAAGAEVGAAYVLIALMVLVLLYAFRRRWSIEAAVAAAAAAMLAGLAVCLILSFGSASEVFRGVQIFLQENLKLTLDLYAGAGFSAETVDRIRQQSPQIVATIVAILPALAFGGFVTLILINIFFLLRRFPEQRDSIAGAPDLREWRAPEWLVWPFLAGGFTLLVPGVNPGRVIALNVLLATSVVYFFHGLSIIAYYFHYKRVPRLLRGFIYLAIFFEQILTIAVVVLGLFDLWGDFRRLKKKNLNPNPAA